MSPPPTIGTQIAVVGHKKRHWYHRLYYFWRRHPIFKLVCLSSLALYDIIGDVTLLLAVPNVELWGVSGWVLDGEDQQVRVSSNTRLDSVC